MIEVTKFEPAKEDVNYQPSSDEIIKLSYIKTRYNDMKSARTIIDKDWNLYQRMIDAIFVPYPDERSSSVVPLASAMIELYVAEAIKIKTEYFVKSETSETSTNAKALEYVWKYDFRKNKRKQAFTDNEYIAAAFWTSVIYTGFESTIKEQKDPIMWDDLELNWETKIIKNEKIIVKNIDIRQFFIDDNAITTIDEASDCILEQRIWFDKFQDFKGNPLYKKIDKVSPISYGNEYHTFRTEEENTKKWKFVKLTHYWNVDKDMYVIVANDNVIIREHPMMSTIDWKKALPFVIRAFWKKNYSIYGRWLCEAMLMFNSEINNLRELLMDAIRKSNTEVLALGKWLSFDWRSFSYENEILSFDWNLWENFKQLTGTPPNQAIFSYIDRIYKDIAVFVWIDIQNIVWEPQQTAFQTEVQREASQKRINVWLTNRDLAYERFADLYKDLLQTYFPRKTVEWIYPIIEIEWEELKNGKFKKKKGKSIFEVTKELLRWDIYIDVYTNTTAPTINAVDKQQKLDLLNSVASISQWYAIAKQSWVDIDSILPIKQTLRDLAMDYNLEVQDKWDNEWVEEAKQQLFKDIQWMSIKPWQEQVLPPEQEQAWVEPTL